jgi:hypothetical protein
MTAEIGIFNKTNIVLAADSAVTIGGINKVFNNANKIFQLSFHEPIGIMIYNQSSWMGIPLEIIIKLFSKSLNTTVHSHLEDYVIQFINYLKENYNQFITEDQIKEFVEIRLIQFLDSVAELCNEESEVELDGLEKRGTELTDELINIIYEKNFFKIVDSLSVIPKNESLIEFKDYSIKEFKSTFKTTINKILDTFYTSFKLKRDAKYTNRILKSVFHEIIYPFSEYEDYSGIVIAGYGVDELFPVCFEIKLGELISNRLRYSISPKKEISQENTALVKPFAQRDMVDVFFSGLDRSITERYDTIIEDEFGQIIKKITEKYHEINSKEISSFFKTATSHIQKKIREFQFEEFIKPTINSIEYLSKEDLIEIAESLVHLTSLKRKTSEKLQTVGGPIDIALITKTGGFVWIKRKDVINRDINT